MTVCWHRNPGKQDGLVVWERSINMARVRLMPIHA